MEQKNRCIQEQRLVELEKKVEYMYKVIDALIDGKADKEIKVVKDWKPHSYRSKFDLLMEKVGTFSEYRWEDNNKFI